MFNLRKAFTLAETLIALTVIGVVAAITVPNIMIQNQKEQAVVRLKKVYSEFSQAATMAKVQYGDYTSWDYSLSNTDFFKKYFYPYVVLSSQSIKNAKEDQIKYYQLSGAVESGLLVMRDQGNIMELMSGAQIFTYPLDYTGADSKFLRKCYAFDINGYKKPNRFGRDLFMLCLVPEKGIVPHSWEDAEPYTVRTREQLKNQATANRYQCNKKGRGMWCAALIMKDGWKIKDDYPW